MRYGFEQCFFGLWFVIVAVTEQVDRKHRGDQIRLVLPMPKEGRQASSETNLSWAVFAGASMTGFSISHSVSDDRGDSIMLAKGFVCDEYDISAFAHHRFDGLVDEVVYDAWSCHFFGRLEVETVESCR